MQSNLVFFAPLKVNSIETSTSAVTSHHFCVAII